MLGGVRVDRPIVDDVGRGDAALELLVVASAVAADVDAHRLGEGVDDGGPDAVEPAGDLVGAAAELSPGVERGHDGLEGRAMRGGVGVDGDATAVVGDGDEPVGVHVDGDAVAVAGHRLIDAVVDDLVDEVVQASLVGAPDVHAWPPPDGFEALEDLNVTGCVLRLLLVEHAANLLG